MTGERVERRLAAILAADVTGYSRLIGIDEEGTLAALKALRREMIDPGIAGHNGRLVKTTGDGLLVEFGSVVDALRCAAAWQRAMAVHNEGVAMERRIEFRLGIHQGDIVVEDGDIFGDGVNVAARLEGLAEPGGICVSARIQEDAAGRLDLAFEDLGEQVLKNIARPVRAYRVGLGPPAPSLDPLGRQAGETPAVRSAPLPLPDKPSIAVLPFANMSGDPEQEYFVDGMVEEIITALSRIRWLFVIARNSTFTYKGQAVGVRQVGRELGVRYVLEGSVRKAGNRVRITGQLIDAITGAHLWADRFDGSLEDVFDLQDQVAVSVAGVIEPALQAAEMRRAAARPTSDLSAYDLYLRALAVFFPITRERMFEAARLLDRAIAIDPRYGPALSWLAICYLRLAIDGWSADDPETTRQKAIELARRALEMAPSDPEILANTAHVLTTFGEDIGATTALIDRALGLNRSYARGWYVSGMIRNFAGDHDLAIKHIETSMRLSPREPIGVPMVNIGMAHFFERRFDEAVAKLLLAVGRLDEARAVVAKLRSITSRVVADDTRLRSPQDRELYLSGLRLAAGED